jgi:hypothetical protein
MMRPRRKAVSKLEISAFPEATRDHLKHLLSEPLLESRALRAQVDTHLNLLREAFLTRANVDQILATSLTQTCLALCWMNEQNPPNETRVWIQAAAHHFVLSEDGEGDFARGGLEDDRIVVNIICKYLGREDLLVEDQTHDFTQEAK